MDIEKSIYIIADSDEAKVVEAFFSYAGWRVERGYPEAISPFTAIVLGRGNASLLQSFSATPAFFAAVIYDELRTIGDILKAFGFRKRLVVVRGAGDLATGTIIKLHNAGYSVIATEIERPTVIRRTVSLAEAVYSGTAEVEGVTGCLAESAGDAFRIIRSGSVPIMKDPQLSIIEEVRPAILVDAAIAKRNLGTHKGMAPFVIALGPGFSAGVDADVVIETKRGHSLGSVIRSGTAIPNTGVPGNIAGYASERVIHSPCAGVFHGARAVGDIVCKGDVIAYVGTAAITATIDGKLRGLLHDGLSVPEGFKIADIDPRGAAVDHLTVSDKARAIAGGVLEAADSFIAMLGK